MHGSARPSAPQISENSTGVQEFSNFCLRISIIDKRPEYLLYDGDFFIGARNQSYPVRLNTFVLTSFKNTLGFAVLVDQHAPQTEPGWPTLSVSALD